jgi:2-hydroxychromene-2-carboxylate isomerase
MAAPALDFWFEFSSTYSYPAALRIGALAAEAGVEVRLRPLLLGPIFQAHGWNTSPFILYPAKGRHMWRDLERILRRAVAAVSAPGALSAIGTASGTRGIGRVAASFSQGSLDGGFLPRRLSRGIRRRAPHRSVGDDQRYSVRAESRS